MTFAREAWVFVLPFAGLALLAALMSRPRSAIALAVVSIVILAFFRIPRRDYAGPASVVLAPANGTVTAIAMIEEPLMGPGRFQRVTTFLSVFNVHVQRAPMEGKVVESRFRPGKKLAAFKPEAGEVNESHLVVLEAPSGLRIGVKQIAGLLARRVVSYLDPGQEVRRGELIGVIKFGSRVDLYLPESHQLLVSKGDRMVEGETPVARPSGAAAEDPS